MLAHEADMKDQQIKGLQEEMMVRECLQECVCGVCVVSVCLSVCVCMHVCAREGEVWMNVDVCE